ncbi:hypothetical protein ACFO3J_30090 [Streptomyces polygonati]|uniref:Uncharacterized protein n=1 Tax=Streptomyces polygonati TaxID=1617087 RepID=A0ABV8HUE0_9ACTN
MRRWAKNTGLVAVLYAVGVLSVHWPRHSRHGASWPTSFAIAAVVLPVVLAFQWWKDRPPRV